MKKLLLTALILVLAFAAPAAADWTVGTPTVQTGGGKMLLTVALTSDAGASGTLDIYRWLSTDQRAQIAGKYVYKAITRPHGQKAPAAPYTLVIGNGTGETYTLAARSTTLNQAASGFDISDTGLLMSIYNALTASSTTLGNGNKIILILELI